MLATRPAAALSVLRWCGLLALTLGGCDNQTAQLRLRVEELERTVAQKDHTLAAQNATIQKQQRLIDDMVGLPPDWQQHVFYPDRLVIDKLSGGQDYDGKAGDDGVTVYLKPLDKVGDVIKAAGDIAIQLYDLANPPGRNFLGEYRFPAEGIGRYWHGKLMTHHYTLKCPWQQGPPVHSEITIRATFVDYLTKRVMSAQTTCKVTLPP